MVPSATAGPRHQTLTAQPPPVTANQPQARRGSWHVGRLHSRPPRWCSRWRDAPCNRVSGRGAPPGRCASDKNIPTGRLASMVRVASPCPRSVIICDGGERTQFAVGSAQRRVTDQGDVTPNERVVSRPRQGGRPSGDRHLAGQLDGALGKLRQPKHRHTNLCNREPGTVPVRKTSASAAPSHMARRQDVGDLVGLPPRRPQFAGHRVDLERRARVHDEHPSFDGQQVRLAASRTR